MRSLLQTTRVVAGPPVRWLRSAMHGPIWRKQFSRVKLGDELSFHTTSGVRLHGRLYSARPARAGFVVVHGWDPLGQSHGYYLGLAETLRSRGYTVLTFNLPGYPGSEAPPTPYDYTLPTLVSAVRAAIGTLIETGLVAPHRVVLFGHSYGGGLVLPTLAQEPNIWRAIIHGPSTWVEKRITGPGAPQRDFFHERYWRYMAPKSPVPLEVYLRVAQALYLPEQFHLVSDGHPPLLLLDGGDEEQKTWSFSHLLYESLPPPCTYYSIPGADHFCNTATLGPLLVSDRLVLDLLADYLDVWLWRE